MKRIKRWRTAARKWALRRREQGILTDLALVGGLAMVAVGVALVYPAAGLIVGGVELAALAVLYERTGNGPPNR